MKGIVTVDETLIIDRDKAAINYVLSTHEFSGEESV